MAYTYIHTYTPIHILYTYLHHTCHRQSKYVHTDAKIHYFIHKNTHLHNIRARTHTYIVHVHTMHIWYTYIHTLYMVQYIHNLYIYLQSTVDRWSLRWHTHGIHTHLIHILYSATYSGIHEHRQGNNYVHSSIKIHAFHSYTST